METRAYLKWTGQYEKLAEMRGRMKLLVPLVLAIIVVLLYLQFRHVTAVIYTCWRYAQLKRAQRTGRPFAEICGVDVPDTAPAIHERTSE